MITVTPIQQKSEQAALCAACGISFAEPLLAYQAQNGEEFAGVCQFNMDNLGGHIHSLASPLGHEDEEALFVMGRAALNFIDLCGVHTAFFEGEGVSHALLSRIGFVKGEDGRYTIDLTDFFTHPCSHHPQ